MGKNDRLGAAIKRNLNEVGMAIFERKALVGMEKAEHYHLGWDFFRVAYHGLYNDMIAHIIKVLDRDERSTTFWYIYNSYKEEIDICLAKTEESVSKIEAMACKLKDIRDKTHFHIDKKAVTNPKVIWKQASIKGKDLASVVDIIWEVLNHVYKLRFGAEFPIPDYTGEDATKIIKAAIKAGIC